MGKKFLKFVTNVVFVLVTVGCLLIIIGQTEFLNFLFPETIPKGSPLNPIIKSIGATLLGSGVFTAIIKSSSYTEIFSNVLGEIIWSKRYIQRRGDKKEIWSMVSRLMYNEKFPPISNEIEEIISTHYFPVSYNFYLEDYEFIINISNIEDNPHFWVQKETVKMTVKPINFKEKISYKFESNIDLPDEDGVQDITEYSIDSVSVNETQMDMEIPPTKKDEKFLHHSLSVSLENQDQYNIVIKRTKKVCKKTNPDKRFFVSYIIKNLKVTVIMDSEMNVNFHKMGTIKEFIKCDEDVNNGVKIVSWKYNGLMLPHQGFIVIFK